MSDEIRPLNDDELLRELGIVLDAVEPPPTDTTVVRDAAFAMMRVDALLAEVIADSLTGASGLRQIDDPDGRSIVLTVGPVLLELELDAGVLHGRLEPLGARCTLVRSTSVVDVDVDLHGTFVVHLEAGDFRVEVSAPDGTSVITPVISHRFG